MLRKNLFQGMKDILKQCKVLNPLEVVMRKDQLKKHILFLGTYLKFLDEHLKIQFVKLFSLLDEEIGLHQTDKMSRGADCISSLWEGKAK